MLYDNNAKSMKGGAVVLFALHSFSIQSIYLEEVKR
jgi:hypothetical protein